jgi:hypothetical protein
MAEIVVCAITLLAFSGLAPFVLSSVDMSNSEHSGSAPLLASQLGDMVRLCYRLVAHPVSSVVPLGLISMICGIGLLWILMARRLVRSESSDRECKNRRAQWEATLALLLVVFIGLAIPMGASFVMRSFDVLRPIYSAWLLPFVYLTIGSGAAAMERSPWSCGALAGVFLALSGAGIGAATLMHHRQLYSHGPSEWIEEIIDGSDAPLAIMHDKSGKWGFIYFPLVYRYGSNLRHWLVDPVDGALEPLDVGMPHAGANPVATRPAPGSTQLWIRSRSLGSEELAVIARRSEGNVDVEVESTGFGPGGDVRVFRSFIEARLSVSVLQSQ